MATIESMWFKIVVIIVAAATIGVCIANIIYFNRLRNSTCNEISSGEAVTMFWINIVLLALASIVFILCIWKLIVPSKCSCDTMKSKLPPGTTHLAYSGPVDNYGDPMGTTTGITMGNQRVILPQGPVTGEATSTYLSANVVAPNEAATLAQQEQYM